MLRGLFLTDSIPRNSSPSLTTIWETILTMFRTFPRIVAMQFLLMIYRLMVQKSFLKQLGNLAACTDWLKFPITKGWAAINSSLSFGMTGCLGPEQTVGSLTFKMHFSSRRESLTQDLGHGELFHSLPMVHLQEIPMTKINFIVNTPWFQSLTLSRWFHRFVYPLGRSSDLIEVAKQMNCQYPFLGTNMSTSLHSQDGQTLFLGWITWIRLRFFFFFFYQGKGPSVTTILGEDFGQPSSSKFFGVSETGNGWQFNNVRCCCQQDAPLQVYC